MSDFPPPEEPANDNPVLIPACALLNPIVTLLELYRLEMVRTVYVP